MESLKLTIAFIKKLSPGKAVRYADTEVPGLQVRTSATKVSYYFRKKYNLIIGETTAEEVKINLGSVYPLKEEKSMEVKGRDQTQGLPRTLTVTSEEIRQALMEPVRLIIDVIKSTLEETPPELAADLVDRGLVVAGGGSLLRGITELIRKETDIPVHRAADPLSCVALGTGKFLEQLNEKGSRFFGSRSKSF